MESGSPSTPRWIIFVLDVFLSVFSITFAFILRYNFQIPEVQSNVLFYSVIVMVGLRSISFAVSGVYAGILRYATLRDIERILLVLVLGSVGGFLVNLLTQRFMQGLSLIPFTVLCIDFILLSLLMVSSRILAKGIYWKMVAGNAEVQNVVVYGSGQTSLTVKLTLERDNRMGYNVIGFLSHHKKSIGKKLDGVSVLAPSAFESLITSSDGVQILMFAASDVDSKTKKMLIDLALLHDIRVLNVPRAEDWINGKLSFNQIKAVNIEDLLERAPISLDVKNVKSQVQDKCILVTGAAGSIGSEIVRQLTRFSPKRIVLVDQAESPLYDIQLELFEEYRFSRFDIEVCDVTKKEQMERIFDEYQPQLVYHAAAYKHVPLMESHPAQAVENNVLGTKIVADLACKYEVERFVMISTDKAVNPTNVMGASKRIAEIYVQSLNRICNTRFITTRFGNVLGSSGSVIPRFRKQIEVGGPITVTHPEITRYFMTIPEACQLVLEAGSMGLGGEIFIFDMGESVKIADLARKMIRLAGFVPEKEIKIEYTGLRPGEKLFEELLNVKENTLPTYHSRIMIAKVREYEHDWVVENLNALFKLTDENSKHPLVAKMKEIVPEFISQNSEFEKLDRKAKVVYLQKKQA